MSGSIRINVRNPLTGSTYQVSVACGSIDRVIAEDPPAKHIRKVAIVSDKRVFGLYGDRLLSQFNECGIRSSINIIGQGERSKTLKTVEKLIRSFQNAQIDREDLIIALGGGIVGDVSGFAASIYKRGVRIIQVPTTLVSMIDSSVGGKTGVNFDGSKNQIGTFYDPVSVVVDPDVLATLDSRQRNAGAYEAVKHAALSGSRLFERTFAMLADLSAIRELVTASRLTRSIADHIAYKASVVKYDPRESIVRTKRPGRKILNLGHTFGHAIESATGFERLLHGEAVGYGMLIAFELSKSLALIDKTELNLLRNVVHRIGALPSISDIRSETVIAAMRNDKKTVGGEISLILLKGIGKPVIVPFSSISSRSMRSAIDRIIRSTA